MAISALLALGGAALWGLFYLVALSPLQEQRSQHVLYARFQEETAAGTVPVQGSIAQGAPVAIVQIPRLGIHNLMVVEGTTPADLEAGPGHRRDTPLPGQAGTSVLMGRSSTYGGPFGSLARLKKADLITVTTGVGDAKYRVLGVRRPGNPVPASVTGASHLTLETSEGRGGGRRVLYVDAALEGPGQAASVGRPTSLSAAESQMGSDQGAWVSIVLWLEAIAVLMVALVWVRVKWGLPPTLLIGAPIVLAAAWGVAQTASQLLPNLW